MFGSPFTVSSWHGNEKTFFSDQQEYLQLELNAVIKERDNLAQRLREDSQTWDDKVLEIRQKCKCVRKICTVTSFLYDKLILVYICGLFIRGDHPSNFVLI